MVSLEDVGIRSECVDPIMTAAREVSRVARAADVPDRSDALARIIEGDIIPRLLLANSVGAKKARPEPVPYEVDSDEVDAFADMMISLNMGEAHHVILAALSRGVALETVLLALFAPTAQRLGDRWTDDTCTFADVTVGLCALQNLLRTYSMGNPGDRAVAPAGAASAMFAALPGEQHVLGILILETFFRGAGWDVLGLPLSNTDEIVSVISRRNFALAGFSLSRPSEVPAMRTLIERVRRASRDPSIIIMVGGNAFNDDPGLVRKVGADITASDASQAVVATQHVLCSTNETQ